MAFLWGLFPKSLFLTTKFQWREIGGVIGIGYMGVSFLGLFFGDLDLETLLQQLTFGGIPAFGYATARLAVAFLGPVRCWKYPIIDWYYDQKEKLAKRHALRNTHFLPQSESKKP